MSWPYPRMVAHRGAGRLAPENTLAAIRLGASFGYAMFEFDVKLAGDGVLVLMHDATLERTTDGRGLAATLRWSDLSRLDAGGWHSRGFAGEPPATMAAIAAFVRSNGFALNIEVKPTPGHERETGEIVAEHAVRLWHGAAVPPLLSSFRPDALEAARARAPQLPRALLLDALHDGWLEQARALDCVAVVAMYALLDATVVARVHDAGMKALAYTVNDPAVAQWLTGNGVDALISDAVDRFSPAID